MICIYCRKTDGEVAFKNTEHVIMQSFGKFGPQTPTLDCVCDECNRYFGKELDQIFSRSSIEGITRYRKGIRSGEARPQIKEFITITIPKEKEFGEWGGVVVWINGTNGQIMGPLPQVHFKTTSGEYIAILDFELIGLDWKARGYSDKAMRVYASSSEKYLELVTKLKTIGINYQQKEIFGADFVTKYKEGQQMQVDIQGKINHVMKRALAKILFNFATKYIGLDETIKSEWDKARKYIRFDGDPLLARIVSEPFWGQETKDMRFADNGYNLRIENDNGNVVGLIQFYNLFLYQFILVEHYSISETKEIAARFIPDQEPYFGKKYRAVTFGGHKIPLIGS